MQPHHPSLNVPHVNNVNNGGNGNSGVNGVNGVNVVAVPDEDGLLQLEPPLSSSDYSFSLDEQENLNDLFDNLPF